MATTFATIIADARVDLLETVARYWTDAELLKHAVDGARALWKDILDLEKGHFITIDETNVAAAASTSNLTGVPADVFRVLLLRPRTIGPSSSNRGLIFKPVNDVTVPQFVQAEAMQAVDARDRVIWYALLNAGAPVAAPTIRIAPTISAALTLTLMYAQTLGTLTSASNNPIPGESDKAIKHYTIAFARAKERPDRAPDPEHLSIYATEARKILTALTPRSVQDPDIVQGMWEGGIDGGGED